FTPTEAAGIGAFGAFIFALLHGEMTLTKLLHILVTSVKTTAMIFTILIGATLFANFVNIAGMPDALAAWAMQFQLHPALVVLVIMLIYVVLGCVLESLSMILLTVPVFYPMMSALGFDLIWFGVIVVVVTEISLITPPVGLNVFVLKAVLPDVPTGAVFRGIMPFIVADIFRLALLVLVPGIVLFLPSYM
ncbi:MAG: TRAP transporter large permease subunit, partial [Hyphomicrobiales bacterium]|nr:TRAP transporter large permease subunit [Hyphomicrobiales bacterium]